MKKSKKFVLAALALLAIIGLLALAGCKNDTVPEPTRYTVKFETAHGTAPADITVVSGAELTDKDLAIEPEVGDNIFEYWYDKDNDAQKPVEEGYTVTKDVTLVAKWRDRGQVAPVTFTPPTDTKFYLGESIAVSLTSEDGATIQYHLGDGSWKDYDAGSKIQVTDDTTITAKATKDGLKDSAETTATYTVRKLEGIFVIPPARTVYSVGQSFDLTGMVVIATYNDGESKNVTSLATTDFDFSSAGVKTVIVRYSEGGSPVTKDFLVDVVNVEEPTILTGYTSPNNTGSEWTYVAFGEWPQTIKDDDVFVDESKSKEMGMFTYYLGSDENYYVKHSDKYYKVEPIVWCVLNKDYASTGKALLLAENILTGGIPYYDVYNVDRTVGEATIYPNNYEHSTVRAWLNGLKYQYKETDDARQVEKEDYFDKGFLQTAFTESARKLIADTSVDNSAASTIPSEITAEALKSDWNDGVNPYASDTCTTDKIFLLSEEEATNSEYGFTTYNNADRARIRVTTDYAKATGAAQSSTGYGGWWWLRSPNFDDSNDARVIFFYGDADIDDCFRVDNAIGGVVPALSISLQ